MAAVSASQNTLWRDEEYAKSVSVDEREALAADWVLSMCKERKEFGLDDTKLLVKVYGLNALFDLLEKGFGPRTGSKKIMTNRAFSCIHTAGQKCAQVDDDKGRQLYQYHRETCEEYLAHSVLPALNALSGPALLKEFKRRWENHKIFTEWMRRIFRYLDSGKSYVHNAGASSLTSSSISLFKTVVFDNKKGDIMNTIQAIARQEREGEQIDRDLLRSVVELFLVMGIAGVKDFKDIKAVTAQAKDVEAGSSVVYEKDFEAPFLNYTRTYYQGKAGEWLSLDTASEYLVKCEAALEADRERVAAYLNRVTEPKLVAVIRDTLVRDRIEKLLHMKGSGAAELLRDNKDEDLGRMYRMFSLVQGGVVEFGKVFREFLKSCGEDIVKKRQEESAARAAGGKDPGLLDVPFVRDLLGLYDKYLRLSREVFHGDAVFMEEFKNSWAYIMNLDAGPVPLPQLLAGYMDSVLRDSKLAEAEQTEATDSCSRLTEYLDDKDVFQHYYEKLLSDRLLNDETTSNEVEKGVITSFKQARGAGFTTKMEGMVSDLVTSGANQEKFQATYDGWAAKEEAAGRARVLFEPVVLCQGHWPQFLDLEQLHEPAPFKSVSKAFRDFYEDVTGGSRQIKWVWARGKAELFGYFQDKAGESDRRTLKMSMLQASVCLKFNEQESYGAAKLAEELGIKEAELSAVVKPMLNRMKKVAGGKPKKIPGPFKQKKGDGDEVLYVFNEKYTNPRREVEIPVPNLTTSKGADKKRVDKGREYQLDAAIVRIMKTRQTLKHQELVMEVSRAIRLFVPQPAEVKKRIEQLINKEYLERDESDRKVYNYLA